MKTIKEQADSYVELFEPYVDDEILDLNTKSLVPSTYIESATRCAIKHVEGLINELYYISKPEYTTFLVNDTIQDGYERIGSYNEILTELKSRI